jgi:hypothetical protein
MIWLAICIVLWCIGLAVIVLTHEETEEEKKENVQ